MATYSTTQYLRLRNLGGSNSAEDDTLTSHEESTHPQSRTRRSWKGIRKFQNKTIPTLLLVSLAINLLLSLSLFTSSAARDQITYSPASNAVEYEKIVFSSAFGIEKSPFQGIPSEQNNELWKSLYNFGISRITTDEARPMENKTLPVPDADGGYVVQLAVFHQLHCLNMLRLGVYGSADMSNADDLFGIEHLDHCIDMLRQSIMCSSDITPITFARTSLDTSMKVVAEVVHTCRSFSNIQRWAWTRKILDQMDKNKVVEDDPLGWGKYIYTPGE